jgi:hypothetical protein
VSRSQPDPIVALGEFIAAPTRWLLRVTAGWHQVVRVPALVLGFPIVALASIFIAVTSFFIIILGVVRVGPGLGSLWEYWEKSKTEKGSST